MIQLVFIVLCSVGYLTALVSLVGSLIASIRRAHRGRPFLAPVPVLSHDDGLASLPLGVVQVHCLVERMSSAAHIDQEDAG